VVKVSIGISVGYVIIHPTGQINVGNWLLLDIDERMIISKTNHVCFSCLKKQEENTSKPTVKEKGSARN
jgi:hypothetical protein